MNCLRDTALARFAMSNCPLSIICRTRSSCFGAVSIRSSMGRRERRRLVLNRSGRIDPIADENFQISFSQEASDAGFSAMGNLVLKSLSKRFSDACKVAAGVQSAMSTLRKMCSMRTPHASGHSFLSTSMSPEAASAMYAAATCATDCSPLLAKSAVVQVN